MFNVGGVLVVNNPRALSPPKAPPKRMVSLRCRITAVTAARTPAASSARCASSAHGRPQVHYPADLLSLKPDDCPTRNLKMLNFKLKKTTHVRPSFALS